MAITIYLIIGLIYMGLNLVIARKFSSSVEFKYRNVIIVASVCFIAWPICIIYSIILAIKGL